VHPVFHVSQLKQAVGARHSVTVVPHLKKCFGVCLSVSCSVTPSPRVCILFNRGLLSGLTCQCLLLHGKTWSSCTSSSLAPASGAVPARKKEGMLRL
jgi:hypothetical protein